MILHLLILPTQVSLPPHFSCVLLLPCAHSFLQTQVPSFTRRHKHQSIKQASTVRSRAKSAMKIHFSIHQPKQQASKCTPSIETPPGPSGMNKISPSKRHPPPPFLVENNPTLCMGKKSGMPKQQNKYDTYTKTTGGYSFPLNSLPSSALLFSTRTENNSKMRKRAS